MHIDSDYNFSWLEHYFLTCRKRISLPLGCIVSIWFQRKSKPMKNESWNHQTRACVFFFVACSLKIASLSHDKGLHTFFIVSNLFYFFVVLYETRHAVVQWSLFSCEVQVILSMAPTCFDGRLILLSMHNNRNRFGSMWNPTVALNSINKLCDRSH